MRRRLTMLVAVLMITVGSEIPTSAATLSLLGDKDCFGLGGSCPDGTRWRDDLGGVFFTSNQGPGDPAFTDRWDSPGTVSYTHTFSDPGSSATLELKLAGIADFPFTSSSYQVLADGLVVGLIPNNTSPNAFQEVRTFDFLIPAALLADGSLGVSFTTASGDGFSMDYSELQIDAIVPTPATLVLTGLVLVGGLSARVWRRRR